MEFMENLSARENFSSSLKDIPDGDIATVLKKHFSLLLTLSDDSNINSRKPLIQDLLDLLDSRSGESND